MAEIVRFLGLLKTVLARSRRGGVLVVRAQFLLRAHGRGIPVDRLPDWRTL
jgi:hypothetical protein